MQQLVESLEDLVQSYDDPEHPGKLVNQCRTTLEGIKENITLLMEIAPDQVAFAIYPCLHLTEAGKTFLAKNNVLKSPLPSWEEVRKNRFFKVRSEADFIRQLPEIDEELAMKILFSVAYVSKALDWR